MLIYFLVLVLAASANFVRLLYFRIFVLVASANFVRLLSKCAYNRIVMSENSAISFGIATKNSMSVFKSLKSSGRKMSKVSPYGPGADTYSERFNKLKRNAMFIHSRGERTVRRENFCCDENNPFFIDHAYSKPKSEWFKGIPETKNDSDTDTSDEDDLLELLENLKLSEDEKVVLNNRKFVIQITKAVCPQRVCYFFN